MKWNCGNFKANPTKTNTIANIAPVLVLFNCSAITSKLVDPVNPYNKEQPYKSKPDESAQYKIFIRTLLVLYFLSIDAKI